MRLLFNVNVKNRRAYEVAADIFNYSEGRVIITLGKDGEAIDAYGRQLHNYLPVFTSRELSKGEIGWLLDVVELLITEEELEKTEEKFDELRNIFKR